MREGLSSKNENILNVIIIIKMPPHRKFKKPNHHKINTKINTKMNAEGLSEKERQEMIEEAKEEINNYKMAVFDNIFSFSLLLGHDFKNLDIDVLKLILYELEHDLVILQKPLDEIHKKDFKIMFWDETTC